MRNGLAFVLAAILVLGSLPRAQTTPPTPLMLLTSLGRRPVATTFINRQEMVATSDLVTLLQVAVREDTSAGGITISYKGKSVVVSPDQAMASVAGRIVPLPAPAVRQNRRWYVPVEFLSRGLGPIYDTRIEYRQASRLVIVGDLRVPRVTVKLDAAGPPTRITVEASPATLITPTTESGRLLVKVDADALDVAPLPQSAGLLDQARVDGTTVVLTLASGAGTPRSTRGTGDNLSRLNVEFPTAGQADAAQTGPAGQATGSAGATGAAAQAGGAAAGAPGNAQNADAPGPPAAPREPARVIVIDPGHGGMDVGATGPSGVQEKDITLAIAKRAKTLIENRLGGRVVLTRDDDAARTLDERSAVANTNKAELFISLHLNSSFAPAMTGAEIYTWRPDPAGRSEDTKPPLTVPLPGGGTRTVTLVRWDQAQARHVDASTLLANQLDAALRDRLPMSLRPVQDAPMRLLSGVDTAAVLVELGYLSNPQQDTALQSDDLQARIAQGLLEAVTAFRAATRGGRP